MCGALHLVIILAKDDSLQIIDGYSGTVKKLYSSDIKNNLSVSMAAGGQSAIISYTKESLQSTSIVHIKIALTTMEVKKIEDKLLELVSLKSTFSPNGDVALVEGIRHEKRKYISLISMEYNYIMSNSGTESS